MFFFNITFIRIFYFRAIGSAWLVIAIIAIPVASSHGILHFSSIGCQFTACLFLHTNGYKLTAYHVITYLFLGAYWRIWARSAAMVLQVITAKKQKQISTAIHFTNNWLKKQIICQFFFGTNYELRRVV